MEAEKCTFVGSLPHVNYFRLRNMTFPLAENHSPLAEITLYASGRSLSASGKTLSASGKSQALHSVYITIQRAAIVLCVRKVLYRLQPHLWVVWRGQPLEGADPARLTFGGHLQTDISTLNVIMTLDCSYQFAKRTRPLYIDLGFKVILTSHMLNPLSYKRHYDVKRTKISLEMPP